MSKEGHVVLTEVIKKNIYVKNVLCIQHAAWAYPVILTCKMVFLGVLHKTLRPHP